jgi:hypothetical protein
VPLGGGDVGLLALGHPAEELVDVEALAAMLRQQPGPELGRQLRDQVPRLSRGDPLGERLQNHADGALSLLISEICPLLDDRDELLVVHGTLFAVAQ